MPFTRFRALMLLALLALCTAPRPALAVIEGTPDWVPDRRPGAPLPEETPPPPSGWQMSGVLTSPYTLGLGLAYLWPGAPAAFKLGGSLGVLGPGGVLALRFQDFRLYGSLVYYLVPDASGGPYVETGLGLARSSGPVKDLGWPVLPHIGFGTTGRFGKTLAWDVNFTAVANGLLALQAGLFY